MRPRALVALAASLAPLLATARPATAGGGPETTVVVVHGDSPVSRRVANEWASRRDVPPSHVVVLRGVPSRGVVDVETFRTRLWGPVRAHLEARGLLGVVDTVAWSADLPYAVDFEADKPRSALSVPVTPLAALPALTFFHRRVEAKDADGYLDLHGNGYAADEPRAFRADVAWRDGVPVEDGEAQDRFLLSTSLAWTGPFGNSVPEALASLSTAAQSDGTRPDGTFYFLVNGDVRAKTREPRFQAAVAALQALGRRAEVLSAGGEGQDGVVPRGKADVLGAMLGIADFAWSSSKSRIVPGAICDHLTSFGAVFEHGSQTKLTELIRHGAAGASGTVFEPYSVPAKFPSPFVHVHYAAGCSLAEAFYRSVEGPYQLLVVGDPLARPFAAFAKVALAAPKAPVAGTVEVAATVEPAPGTEVAALELWVDGVRVARAAPGAPLSWDTAAGDDGEHDVRVVAVDATSVATRSYAAATFVVANAKRTVTVAGPASVPLDASLPLAGRAAGATSVEVANGSEVVATAKVVADGWRAAVPAGSLGLGPSRLVVRALHASGPAARATRDVVVAPPAPRKAPKTSGGKPGFLCTVVPRAGRAPDPFPLLDLGGVGTPEPVEKLLAAKAKGDLKEVRFEGEVDAGPGGLLQWTFAAAGEVEMAVDGKPALARTSVAADRPAFALLSLAPGWHTVSIRYAPSGAPTFSALLGGDRVTTPLAGAMLRH